MKNKADLVIEWLNSHDMLEIAEQVKKIRAECGCGDCRIAGTCPFGLMGNCEGCYQMDCTQRIG